MPLLSASEPQSPSGVTQPWEKLLDQTSTLAFWEMKYGSKKYWVIVRHDGSFIENQVDEDLQQSWGVRVFNAHLNFSNKRAALKAWAHVKTMGRVARQTADFTRMEGLLKAIEDPLGDVSRVLGWARNPPKTPDASSRSLARASQAVLDNLVFNFEDQEKGRLFKKTYGRKFTNIRKLFKAWAGADTWAEMEPVIRGQQTQSKSPWDKFREARGMILGAIQFFDREVDESLQVGGYGVALMTHPQADWDRPTVKKLQGILEQATSILKSKGFGLLTSGTVVATPGKTVRGNTLASYHIQSHVMHLAVGGDANRVIQSFIHELGHAYYFEHMGGLARKDWVQFFGDNSGDPNVDGIIRDWEAFASDNQEHRFSPYFYKHLKQSDPQGAMWLTLLVEQLDIQEPQTIYGFKRNTVPGLDQLKAKKDEAKVFLHPVTAYSGTSAEELFAEAFAHYLIDGPRRLPPLVRDVFKRAVPQSRMASRKAVAARWLGVG